MNIFSFRAECLHDVNLLKNRLIRERIGYEYVTEQPAKVGPGDFLPDLSVEIKTDATWLQLMQFLSEQTDSHVIAESLRQVPLNENNCERDRSVYAKFEKLKYEQSKNQK